MKSILSLYLLVFSSCQLATSTDSGSQAPKDNPSNPPPDGVTSLGRNRRWASQSNPPSTIAKLIALDVICGKDHMTVRAEFNGPFQGVVFSKGTFGQDNCVYVKSHSGVTHTTFKVNYDACGTKPDLQGKYYENTIVIQYGADIIEAWDEAKRLRCEWFEAYEKPATFRPAIPVADLDVVEMNFQGDDIDCWMEIQEGKGPFAREVNRIVPVGQPMTIVVSINDYNGQFDMRVKSCFAHDGVKPPIHLTDESGCVLRPKMLSPFKKVRDQNSKATVVSYAHFYAFKFPDTMNVQIQCTVEACRHGCPDACQKGPYPAPVREIHPKVTIGRRPETEETAGSHPIPSLKLPGINDPAIINHASQFLEAQGIDLHRLRAELNEKANHPESAGEESQNQPQFSLPHQGMISEKAPIYTESTESLDDDSKPVIKVVEVDVPADKKKSPIITEQSSFFPADLNQASKLLSELGLNMDLSQFAAGLAKNPKDLQSLLQNDKIREFAAAASGLPFNGPTFVPDPQPLVNLTDSDPTTRATFMEPMTEAPSSPVIFNVTRAPFPLDQRKNSYVRPQNPGPHMKVPQNYRPHAQHQFGPHGHPPPPSQNPFGAGSAPVVQVLNIPMSPNIPPVQMPPSFTNFIHLPPNAGIPPPKAKRPLFFPSFSLPSLSALNPFATQTANWKDRNDQPHPPADNLQPRMDTFPQGPRAMRLRRSASGSQLAVNKQFQVVTAIDLAFLPNATTDLPPVFEGRREEVIYGVCLPIIGFAAVLTCFMLLIIGALAFIAAMIHRINRRSHGGLSPVLKS